MLSLVKLIKKLPLPGERGTIKLIKVKSCNILLRTLLLCILSHLISSETHIFSFVSLSTPRFIFRLHEQGCDDPWVFSNAKICSGTKKFGKLYVFCVVRCNIFMYQGADKS